MFVDVVMLWYEGIFLNIEFILFFYISLFDSVVSFVSFDLIVVVNGF